MELNEYQKLAKPTAIYPDAGRGTERALNYVALKLAGEAGEYAEKQGKWMRDHCPQFPLHVSEMPSEYKTSMAKELGDILWYLANASAELGYSLEAIASMNLEKLRKRFEDGQLGGSGDDR